MKQSKIINAYEALKTFANNDKLSYDTLLDLFQLKNQLQSHIDFFDERHNAIKDKYRPLADENGNISGEALENYTKDFNELANMEKDISAISKPIIKVKEAPGLTLVVMDALQDFVTFEKE